MLDVLYELAKEKEYACFYSNPQLDKFKFGFVLAVNENEIAIHEISPDGEDDGIIVMPTERIYRVERNSQYLEKMKKLCSGTVIADWLTPIDESNILFSVLLNPVLRERIVSIELHDSGYYETSGFVEEVKNDNCLVIRQVDDYGFEDGITYLKLEDVTELVISSDLQKRIQKLWKINHEG